VRALRAFVALLRMELSRLLRSPAVVRVVVLPYAFAVPALALALSLGMSAGDAAVVLVPPDLPESLVGGIDAEPDLRAVVVQDPLSAYAEGQGAAAVVAWTEGAGLGQVRVAHGPGEAGLYSVSVAAASEDLADDVDDALRAGARAEVEGWIAAAGVDPDTLPGSASLVTARPDTVDVAALFADTTLPGTDLSLQVVLLAGLVLLAAVPGAQLLPILGAHERESGVALQLAVAPPRAELRLAARLAAFALFLTGSLGLLGFNMLLPIAALPGADLPAILLVDFALRALVSGLTASTLAIVLGEAVSEPSRAMAMAGIVVYATLGAVAAALASGSPFVPLGGLALAEWGPELALVVLAHLGLVAVMLGIAGRLHRWRLGTRT
jgi:hypothetical protein